MINDSSIMNKEKGRDALRFAKGMNRTQRFLVVCCKRDIETLTKPHTENKKALTRFCTVKHNCFNTPSSLKSIVVPKDIPKLPCLKEMKHLHKDTPKLPCTKNTEALILPCAKTTNYQAQYIERLVRV